MSVAAEIDRPKSWNIPPLVRGGELPEGFRIGETAVVHLRGMDASCEVYVVTFASDGSSCMARVARRSAMAEDPALAGSMLAGAQRLCGLRHPNLLAVLGCGWTDEASPRPYVLHERVVGRDLASYQARHGCIEPALLLAIGSQCAAALEALHRSGLAHGDLRRGSAALVPAGGDQFRIKLGGFEHARAIRGGATTGDEPLVAADLAALGAMLAELAAGVEDVPEELAGLIARMTAADPGQRPASAAEVKDAIAAIRAELDPAGSVTAAGLSCTAPRRAANLSGVRRAPEFGQVSLVMPIERPAEPIRAATPWLTLGILLVSAVAVLLAATLGGGSLVLALEARSLDVDREEPALELAAPRTVPDRVQAALPAVVGLGRSFVARGQCEEREPAPRVMTTPRKRSAPLMTAPAVEVAAEEPTAPTEPEVQPVDDGLGLLPVGAGGPREAVAGQFLATSR